MRPDHPWKDAVEAINVRNTEPIWTVDRLKRATKRFARDRLVDPALLARSPPRMSEDRLVTIVASIARANPSLTLKAIATQLEAMRERTPRASRTGDPPRSNIY